MAEEVQKPQEPPKVRHPSFFVAGDFIPIVGYSRYCERNRNTTTTDPSVERVLKEYMDIHKITLVAYNAYLIALPTFATVVTGIELFLRK